MNRCISLGLAALLLAGCDDPKRPAKPDEPPLSTPLTQRAASPAAPRLGVSKVAPAGQPLPVGQPLVETRAEQRARLPRPPASSPPPEIRLDLSVPQELADQPRPQPPRQLAKPKEPASEGAILPPLFGPRKQVDSFELGAQLITDQAVGQAKDAPVQGAELQFRFHR